MMSVHPTVLEHLHRNILPHVFQVHDMGVPYRAGLWKDGERQSKTGSAMFNIKKGRLTVEYFSYDNHYPRIWLDADDQAEWKLVFKDTQVAVPVGWIRRSPKARTMYGGVEMPVVVAYECGIQGWLGDPMSELRSATLTITDLPDLHLPRSSRYLPEETTADTLTHMRRETRSQVLRLEAGGWESCITEHILKPSDDTGRLHIASIRRTDKLPFVMGDEESIVTALTQFLSFQAGGWINVPTIVGYPSDATDWVTKRAFVGRLTPRTVQHRNQWTATSFETWPELFKEFWKRHVRNTRNLNNAIHHYVSCSEIFENNYGIDFAMVAARSTLESLTRWWNDLPENYEFHGDSARQLLAQLMKAVERAELGKDVGRHMDVVELRSVVKEASQFRNRIDHGLAGNVETQEAEKIITHQQYMHNLARFLILAKLGLRNTDARGRFYAPTFEETSQCE